MGKKMFTSTEDFRLIMDPCSLMCACVFIELMSFSLLTDCVNSCVARNNFSIIKAVVDFGINNSDLYKVL